MSGRSRLVTAELSERAKLELKKQKKISRATIRLRSIIAAGKYRMETVAKIFGITSNTLRSWIYNFRNGSVNDLEIKCGRGRKCHIGKGHREKITAWVEQDSTLTIDKICFRLKEELGIKTSRAAVHRTLKKT